MEVGFRVQVTRKPQKLGMCSFKGVFRVPEYRKKSHKKYMGNIFNGWFVYF